MTLNEGYMPDAGRAMDAYANLIQTKQDKQKVSSVSNIKLGKLLIVIGFLVSIVGIVAYCMAGFTTDFGAEISIAGKTGLALVAAGTVCWFIGALKFFQGAVEANLPEELFF